MANSNFDPNSNSKCFNCGAYNPSLQPKHGSKGEIKVTKCSAVLFDLVLPNVLAVPDHVYLQLRQQSESEFVEYCHTCKYDLKSIKDGLLALGRMKVKVEQYLERVQTKFIQSRPFLDLMSKWDAYGAEEEEQSQVGARGGGGGGHDDDVDDEGQNLNREIKTEKLQEDHESSSLPLPQLEPKSVPAPVTFEHIANVNVNFQLKSEKIQNVGSTAVDAQVTGQSSSSSKLPQIIQGQGQRQTLPTFGHLISNPPAAADPNSKCFNCGTPDPSLQPKLGSKPELTEAECSAVLFDVVLQNGLGLAVAVPDHLFIQMRRESESEFVEYCRMCKNNLKRIRNRLVAIEPMKVRVEQCKAKVQARFIQSRPFLGSMSTAAAVDSNSSQGTTSSGLVAMEIISGGPFETICADNKAGLMEHSDNGLVRPARQNSEKKDDWKKRYKEARLQCRYCTKILKHIHLLRAHMRNTHADQVRANPFECKFCPERFAVKWRAVKHKEIHEGENRYECSVCGKKCKSRKSVKKHFKSAHRQKT